MLGGNPDFEVRLATHAEVGELEALARRAVEQRSQDVYTPEQVGSAAACITVPDLDLIEDGTLFAAVVGERIVGCGGCSRRRKLYTGSEVTGDQGRYLDPATEPARIRAFFVEQEMAGRGVGRAIYERCAADAAAAEFRRFELVATLPGIPFYERLGFAVLQRSEILLTDGTRLPTAQMAIELADRPES